MAVQLNDQSGVQVQESPRMVEAVSALLASADIQINGSRPWDMQLKHKGVIQRALARGNLGLGEAYMDGHWDVERLDQFFDKILRARLDEKIQPMRLLWPALRARIFNLQTIVRARQVGVSHYDLGNDFYAAMLDRRMTYTCGYWWDAKDLDQAQEAKLEMICRKLYLEPGMTLLDIGSGWGSLLSFAAERYGIKGVGISISKEQVDWCRQRFAHLPIEFRLQDYRLLNERFDRVASVGMFEHVGRKNHRTMLEVVHRCLADDGLFLLHTIGKNRSATTPDPWIDQYIFPNGDLPSAAQIAKAAEGLFVTEDVQNFGADYDKTLMAWHQRFQDAWPRFAQDLGERFHRMWRYYLLSCAGAFRARDIQLWQWVLSKHGVIGGYERPLPGAERARVGDSSAK